MGKREEEEERTKKRAEQKERQTNLLVVVQFFFETKLLLFLNCVCGSCCAIDIVRVQRVVVMFVVFPRESPSQKKGKTKSELKP